MAADGAWIILRTAGRATLSLAASLAEDGFEVWTPRETRRVRVPRANVRRDVTLPLMPSYVFARAHHLVDLLQMASQPFKPRRSAGRAAHRDFTVMHFHDAIPLIADRHLTALRQLEAKRTPRQKGNRFSHGVDVQVKIEGGSFAGMKGRVERSDDLLTLVCFDRRMTVKIPTSLLQVSSLQSEPDLAAALRKAA